MPISAKDLRRDEQLTLRANVTITQRDKAGRYVSRRKIRNLVVAKGRDLAVEMLGGTANAAPTHIALGTGSTAVTDADTALGSEQYRDLITRRRNFTARIQFQLYLDTTMGNGFNYTEAGIINVRNGVSILFARVIFAAIGKDSSTTLTVSWDVYLTSS